MDRRKMTMKAMKRRGPFASGPRYGGPEGARKPGRGLAPARRAPNRKGKLKPLGIQPAGKGPARRYLRFGSQGGGADGKRKQRWQRMREGKPVRAPSEDSLGPKLTRKLTGKGYTYGGGRWYLPRNPNSKGEMTSSDDKHLA